MAVALLSPALAASPIDSAPQNTWVQVAPPKKTNGLTNRALIYSETNRNFYLLQGVPHRYSFRTDRWEYALDPAAEGRWGEESGDTINAPKMKRGRWMTRDSDGVTRPNTAFTPRIDYQYAHDKKRDLVYVFTYHTMMRFNPVTEQWAVLNDGRGARPTGEQHLLWGSMEYDPVNEEVVLFGGNSNVEGGTPGTWVFDPSTNKWRDLKLDVEPSARGYSPTVYDPVNKKIILFGGDHLDHTLADTWAYDVASRSWQNMKPALSPPPGAAHILVYLPKAKRVLLFDSQPGIAVPKGVRSAKALWTYDYATNRWQAIKQFGKGEYPPHGGGLVSGNRIFAVDDQDRVLAFGRQSHWGSPHAKGTAWAIRIDAASSDAGLTARQGVPPGAIQGRTGLNLSRTDFETEPADVAGQKKRIEGLADNVWLKVPIGKRPPGKRAWGTAVYVPQTDEIIRFTGGHAAHTGSDVPHYHVGENRYSLGYSAEFPADWGHGATGGTRGVSWSFGQRPFPSHSYRNNTYDSNTGMMVLNLIRDSADFRTAKRGPRLYYTWFYDPQAKDWLFPPIKVKGGNFGLADKLVGTPRGVVRWAGKELWLLDTTRFDRSQPDALSWARLPATGKLPSTADAHDSTSVVYDTRRDRLIFRDRNDRLHAYSFDTGAVSELNARNRRILRGAGSVDREAVYLPQNDVVVWLNRGEHGLIAYNVHRNNWFALPESGHKPGAGVSSGLVYEPRRGLLMVSDGTSNVYMLKPALRTPSPGELLLEIFDPFVDVSGRRATLSLETSIPASCRAARKTDQPFHEMPIRLDGSGTLQHQFSEAGLDAGSYSYFVRCAHQSSAPNSTVKEVPFFIGLKVGDIEANAPTLRTMGLSVPILAGDQAHTATARVRYRRSGSKGWTEALPLMRVRPQFAKIKRRREFAGTLFGLSEGTVYDVEVRIEDGDFMVSRSTRVATRSMPRSNPEMPIPVAVNSTEGLKTALRNARPGHVIKVAPGNYNGNFTLDGRGDGGTVKNPIVIRGADRAKTVLRSVKGHTLSIFRDFVTVENLTIEANARSYALRADDVEHLVIRGNLIRSGRGFEGSHKANRFYTIYDNVWRGMHQWKDIWPRRKLTLASGRKVDSYKATWNSEGIGVSGQGHAIFNNTISGYGDAISITRFTKIPNNDIDIYHNRILWTGDDGLELDDGARNVRAWENQVLNSATMASVQHNSDTGGPVYVVRNVSLNPVMAFVKLNDGPTGVYILNNTMVRTNDVKKDGTPSSRSIWSQPNKGLIRDLTLKNNLLISFGERPKIALAFEARTEEATTDFDYNRYYPDSQFWLGNYRDEKNFARSQARGSKYDNNGGILDHRANPVFKVGPKIGKSILTLAPPRTYVLNPDSNAADGGAVIPGITDGFSGRAPDVGAYEIGAEFPHYGASWQPSPLGGE